MIPLFLDTETYSPVDLKTCGAYRYAEEAEVIMWQYAIGDGEVIVLDYDDPRVPELKLLLSDKRYEIVIHNSNFDRVVIEYAEGIKIPTSRIFDTMVCALAHSLPGSLGELCDICNIPMDKAKDKEGGKLIGLFCKPQKDGGRKTKHTHPTEWEKFRNYGKRDITALRELYKILPKWNFSANGRRDWETDQQINDRGFCVDLDLVRNAIRASEEAKRACADKTSEITNGQVRAATQRDALLQYIETQYGHSLHDLTATSVKQIVKQEGLPEEMLELLLLRLESTKTSTAKYRQLLRSVCKDGRLRGALQFCGASRTGRWAGRLFQPQNLPGSSMKSHEIEAAICDLKHNAEGL